MCNLTDNFYEDLILDLQYQEYIYRKKLEQSQQYDEFFSVEEKAYEIMCEQANKDQEEFETAMLEKEYRKIQEWELSKEMAETDYQYCN